MLSPILVTSPASMPVTLTEAKAWLDVTYSDDDTMITAMIGAATAHLDGYTGILGRAIMPQTWKQQFCGFQTRMRFPHTPIASVETVKYYDDDNALQTANSAIYGVYEDHLGAFIELLDSQSWPSTYARQDAVEINYIAGYANAEAVPEPIKTAIKMLVADLYEHREAQSEMNLSENRSVGALIAPYRKWAV